MAFDRGGGRGGGRGAPRGSFRGGDGGRGGGRGGGMRGGGGFGGGGFGAARGGGKSNRFHLTVNGKSCAVKWLLPPCAPILLHLPRLTFHLTFAFPTLQSAHANRCKLVEALAAEDVAALLEVVTVVDVAAAEAVAVAVVALEEQELREEGR